MKDSLVSVIVPVYKVEEYLERCVESIVNQTYKNLEIVLVDDGSPDNCPAMCDEFAKKDKRIKVIHKENGGLSDARNFGTDACKGEYILYVDSDDYILENTIKVLMNNLVETGADISFASYAYVFDGQKPEIDTQNNYTVYETNDAMKEFVTDNSTKFTVAWCKLFKREVVGDIRFPVGKLHEDEYTTHKIFHKAKKVVFSKATLYMYYQRSNSIMGTLKPRNLIDTFYAAVEKLNYYRDNVPEIYPEFAKIYFGSLVNPYVKLFRFKDVSKQQKKDMKKNIKKMYKILKKDKIEIFKEVRLMIKFKMPRLYNLLSK